MRWLYLLWWMAMIPLGVMVALRAWHRRLGVQWWAVALALGLSWLSDATALALAPAHRWLPSLLYPVLQGIVIAWAFLTPRSAKRVTVVLFGMLVVAWLQVGPWHPDTLVRTAAWVTIAMIGWQTPMATGLKWTLLVTFGAGWVVWVWHATVLSVASWFLYQALRAVGIAVFTVGALRAARVEGA